MKTAFIGGGNMTAALVAGLLQSENPANLFVADRNAEKRREFARRGICAAPDADNLLSGLDVLILAVKPKDMRAVCENLPQTSATIVSVAAGPALPVLARWLPFSPAALVRAMPNTPAAVAAGMTVCCGEVGEKTKSEVSAVFSAVGKVLWLADESMLSAAVAVSGSGPAYLFYFAEAMQETAVELGFSPEDARELVCQTLQGGGKMLAGEKSATELRRAVMSKGGTTERAVAAMESGKLKEIVAAAMRACQTRAEEMAKPGKE